MTAIVCRRMIFGLAFSMSVLASYAATRAMGQAESSVTLSNLHPVGYFDVAPKILAGKPPILFLSISKIANPQRMSCEIIVSLSRTSAETKTGHNILVGSFGLYPPDRPASFQLDTAKAFKQLETGDGSSESKIKLEVELRRVHESEPWKPIELTLAQPEWRTTRESR